jgi:hypothetical protein
MDGGSQPAPTAAQIVSSVATAPQRVVGAIPSASFPPSPVQRTPFAPLVAALAPSAETGRSALPTVGAFAPVTPATPMATPLVAAVQPTIPLAGVATPTPIPMRPGAIVPPAQASVATATAPVQRRSVASIPATVEPVVTDQPSLATVAAPVQRQPVLSAPLPVAPRATGQPVSPATAIAEAPQPAALAALPTPPPASVQRQVEPAATPSDGIDDRTWSRLQSAFRKAKAQASESGSPALPPATPASAGKRSPIAPAVAQRQPERSPLRRTTISEQSAGRPLPAALPPDDTSVPTAPPVRTLPADQTTMTPSAPVLQRSPASPPPLSLGEEQASTGNNPPSTPAPGLITSPQPPEDAPATVRPPGLALPGQQAVVAVASPVQPLAPLPPGAATTITLPAVAVQRTAAPLSPAPLPLATVAFPETEWPATAQPDPVPEGSLALEAVWPVQRLPAVTAFADAPAPTGFSVSVEAPPPVLTDTVRRQLETTHTARPTDSKVDILMPRRPRPMLRSSEQPLAPIDAATPLQRQSNQAPPTASVAHEPQLAASEQQQAATQPALVPTEIGPLPADLWRLIGAQTPTPSPTVPTAAPVDAQPQVTPTVSPPLASAAVSAVQRAPVTQMPLHTPANAPAAASFALSAPALHTEPPGAEAVPGSLAALTGHETLATAMAAPATYTPAAPMPATVAFSFVDSTAAVDQGTMTPASATASASVIPVAAPGTLGPSPAPAVTDALQLQPLTTAPPISAPTNPARSPTPPVLVTQQAPSSVLRQAEPAAATPVTTGSAPVASKKKRRKRSTPTN